MCIRIPIEISLHVIARVYILGEALIRWRFDYDFGVAVVVVMTQAKGLYIVGRLQLLRFKRYLRFFLGTFWMLDLKNVNNNVTIFVKIIL